LTSNRGHLYECASHFDAYGIAAQLVLMLGEQIREITQCIGNCVPNPATPWTAPKQVEEASLNLASIVESSDDAIIGERPDGTITSWNGAATRIFGYSDAEMIGSNIVVLTTEGDDDGHEVVQRIQRGELVRRYETVRRRKDGGEIAVDVTISPIRDALGRIVGASTIARDITDRKRVQEKLLHAQKMESLRCARRGRRSRFQ
jgi:PAS domain S-box-containing protein